MRILLSIPLLMLISFSGIRVGIAYHFCGGEQVAARVSLSEKLASCGMEGTKNANPSGESINIHCCDNQLSVYWLNNNYLTSSPEIGFSTQNTVVHEIFFAGRNTGIQFFDNYTHSQIRPPGQGILNTDTQPVLCIFRF